MIILSLDYPPNDGGISRLTAGLVRGLSEQGSESHVVTFVAGKRSGPARPATLYTEVERGKGKRDWQVLRAVRTYLAMYGPSVPVLATVWNPEATLAMLAGARRVSILAHGNEVMPYGNNRLKARLRRFVLERARVVICNSHYTEGLVREIAPKTRTTVVNPAVEADAFKPATSQSDARQKLDLTSHARVLLTVARLDPIKGHETVLRALAMLKADERKGMIYCIVGNGELRDHLEGLVQELRLNDNVRFAGFVADMDLPLWYAAADLFLLCSVVDSSRRGMEGFGMALTEAQAAELPVIGTRSGGIPDAIKEEEGGWLIDERDAGALAGYLRKLAQDQQSFADQGILGAKRVRREMSWTGYAARIRELI